MIGFVLVAIFFRLKVNTTFMCLYLIISHIIIFRVQCFFIAFDSPLVQKLMNVRVYIFQLHKLFS